MSTEAPVSAHNPARAMESFIGGLQQSGMDEAAKATAEKPPEQIAPVKETPAPEKPVEKPAEVKPVETKQPEKPAAPAKETPADNPEDKWPRSAADWEARKAAQAARLSAAQKERDEIKADRDKLNSEIEKLRKSGPSPELDSLKAERDQLSEQLRVVSVENHPKFKAYFENKTTAQLELAKRIVGVENADRIVELLKSPESAHRDAELETLTAGLSGIQQSRLGGVVNALAEIQAERQSEISRAKEHYEKMQSDQKAQSETQTKQAQELFDTLSKSAMDPTNGHPAFRKKDGDEAWNNEVSARVEAAKNLCFGQTKPEQLIKAAMDAVALPSILKLSASQAETIKRLESQVAELSRATPTVVQKEGEKDSGGNVVPITHKPNASPMEAMGNFIKGIQAAGNA